MARQESIVNMGYYATPFGIANPRVPSGDPNLEGDTSYIGAIARMFQPAPAGTRAIDPTAGRGHALKFFSDTLGMTAYANEIEANRVLSCERFFGEMNTRCGDIYELSITPRAFQFEFINPPYGDDLMRRRRSELGMLAESWKWMQEGAYVLFVSYAAHISPDLALNITEHTDQADMYVFPEFHMEAGRFQTLIVCRVSRKAHNAKSRANALVQQAAMPHFIPSIIDAEAGQYVIPAPEFSDENIYFTSVRPDHLEVLKHLNRFGAEDTAAYYLATQRPIPDFKLKPAMQMRFGHLVSIMAAGGLNGARITTDHGAGVIRAITSMTEDKSVKEEEGKTTTTFRTRAKIYITVLHTDGYVLDASSDEDMAKFLEGYGDQLYEIAANRFPPLYDLSAPMTQEPNKKRWLPLIRPQKVMGKFPLYPAQQHTIAAMLTILESSRYKRGMFIGETGSGKAQPLDANILTPAGWKLMRDIRLGDKVIGVDGKPTAVTGVYPQGEKAIYRVTMTDGSSTETCGEHLWEVNTKIRKWRGNPARVMALQDLAKDMHLQDGGVKHYIPMVEPVEFAEQSLPLHPYLLGALLGDGGLTNAGIMFSTGDSEMVERVRGVLPDGASISYAQAYDYRITCGGTTRTEKGTFAPSVITKALRQLGLVGVGSADKFIPAEYLYNSVENRIALLRGLLDTDGSVGSGYAEYTTISERLAYQVRELAQSLGGHVSLKSRHTYYTHNGERRQGKLSYRLNIVLPRHINPFALSRKAEKYRSGEKYQPTRAIQSVEYVGVKPAQCIMVDSPRHLYVTDDYIVTHNTTIGLATIEALYRDGCFKPGQVAYVRAPGHLVNKWTREAENQLPHCRVFKITLKKDPLVTMRQAMNFAEANPTGLVIVIADKNAVKFGDGNAPAFTEKRHYWDKELGELVIDKHIICPVTGVRVTKKDADGNVLSVWPEEVTNQTFTEGDEFMGYENGKPVYRSANHRSNALWQEGRLKASYTMNFEPVIPGKGRRPIKNVRGPMWRVIERYYKGRIAIMIEDEAHEGKGLTSDVGSSMVKEVRCADRCVFMTGSIFNGYADSVYPFAILCDPSLLKRYPWTPAGIQSWGYDMGVMERVIEERDSYSNGSYTGVKRKASPAKLAAGTTPFMPVSTLPFSVFLEQVDMGKALPPFEEVTIGYDLPEDVLRHYTHEWDFMHSVLVESSKQGEHGFGSAYFHALAQYPDTCYKELPVIWRVKERDLRTNQVIGIEERLVTTLDAQTYYTNSILPKEQGLVDEVRKWLASHPGQGVGIYVQQTGKRDYRERIQAIITQEIAEANVHILDSDEVKRELREQWIMDHGDQGMNVLITNPKLVETGLDLLKFSLLIFFEPEYKLFTLIQAKGRSRRINQVMPCKVIYMYYRDTLQEDAIGLIARKMKGADVVNGKSAAIQSATNMGGDIQKELESGVRVKIDLAAAFEEINKREFGNDAMWEVDEELAVVEIDWFDSFSAPCGEVEPEPTAMSLIEMALSEPPVKEVFVQLSMF